MLSKIIKFIKYYYQVCFLYDIHNMRPRFFLFLFNLFPNLYTLYFIRNFLLKLGGANINVFHAIIWKPLWCTDLRGISIGTGVFINMGCRFQGTSKIEIGNDCQIGPFSSFETINHGEVEDEDYGISIGDGVWIGARAVLTPGVAVGRNSVIAAGAVVTRNVPDDEVWGGVPARKIKDK